MPSVCRRQQALTILRPFFNRRQTGGTHTGFIPYAHCNPHRRIISANVRRLKMKRELNVLPILLPLSYTRLIDRGKLMEVVKQYRIDCSTKKSTLCCNSIEITKQFGVYCPMMSSSLCDKYGDNILQWRITLWAIAMKMKKRICLFNVSSTNYKCL